MTPSRAGQPRAWAASESAVHRVLAAFRIDRSSVELIAPLVSGRGRIQGYRVRADERDWALKRYTAPAAVERLATSHSLELRLAETGFPLAPLRVTGDGGTVVRDGPAWYSLHRWVEGQQVSISDRDALIEAHPHLVGELAALVATLHMVSGRVPGEGGTPDLDRLLRVPHATVRRIRGRRRRVLSKWQMLHLKPRTSEFDRWILRVLPEVATRAETLAEETIAHRVGPSEAGLIHNDVNWENLILDEGYRVQSLLDFDNVVRAPWVLEVGACAVVLAGADPGRVDQFVSGYEAASGTALDRDLVRLGMELKCVRSIATSVLSYLDGCSDTELIAPWCHHLHESLTLVQRG